MVRLQFVEAASGCRWRVLTLSLSTVGPPEYRCFEIFVQATTSILPSGVAAISAVKS